MLTLHTADLLAAGGGQPPVPGGAVLVEGDRIVAVGPAEELAAAHPGARVRRWPGTLGPALLHDGPLPAAPTPRERVHALLRLGAGALPSALVTDPADRAAATRSGVLLVPPDFAPPTLRPATRADLAVFAPSGPCVATILAGRLLHRRT